MSACWAVQSAVVVLGGHLCSGHLAVLHRVAHHPTTLRGQPPPPWLMSCFLLEGRAPPPGRSGLGPGHRVCPGRRTDLARVFLVAVLKHGEVEPGFLPREARARLPIIAWPQLAEARRAPRSQMVSFVEDKDSGDWAGDTGVLGGPLLCCSFLAPLAWRVLTSLLGPATASPGPCSDNQPCLWQGEGLPGKTQTGLGAVPRSQALDYPRLVWVLSGNSPPWA